ncbi:MAG: PKD domain-containing protein [Candidatus Thermoplasmatota archaeon]
MKTLPLFILIFSFFQFSVPTEVSDNICHAIPPLYSYEAEEIISSSRTTYPLVVNFTFTVSFEWEADSSSFTDVQEGLARASNIIYDYTDGQMIIKEVHMYNNKARWSEADIQVFNKYNLRASANLGGISGYGHVYIGRDDYGYAWNSNRGAVTLAHEIGHYALWFEDHYTDDDGPLEDDCLMADSYTTEVCTKTTFNNRNNPKMAGLHPCWEIMKQHYPQIVEVTGTQDPGPTTGPRPKFVWHYPDISILSNEILVSNMNATEGETIEISAFVHNKDLAAAGDVVVNFYDGPIQSGVIIGTTKVSISYFEKTIATIIWRAKGGLHTIYILVDATDSIKEVDEKNNIGSIVVPVNSIPVINDIPDFFGKEDMPLVIDFTPYEYDKEDIGASLVWKVTKYDKNFIISITSNILDDVFTFYPKSNWFGKTSVSMCLTDSKGASRTKEINLTWDSVNDLPIAKKLELSSKNIYRTDSIEIFANGEDIEDKESELSCEIEYSFNTLWTKIDTYWSSGYFLAKFKIEKDSEIGFYSFRVRFKDLDNGYSNYIYENRSLEVKNNLPEMKEVFSNKESFLRGEVASISILGTDLEDEKLVFEAQVKKGDVWENLSMGYEFSGEYVLGTFFIELTTQTGYYSIRFRAVDKDSGISDWMETNFDLLNNIPEVKEMTTDKSSIYRGEKATITITAKDVESSLLKLEIKHMDKKKRWENTFIGEIINEGEKFTVIFAPTLNATDGKYSFKARVYDGDCYSGWFLSEFNITVKNHLPKAKISSKKSSKVGEKILFDGSGSKDVEDESLSYVWDFGDGEGAFGMSVEHEYTRSGNFVVKLTVEDRDKGTDTKETIVSITQLETAEEPLEKLEVARKNPHYLLLIFLPIFFIILSIAIFLRRRKRAYIPEHALYTTPVQIAQSYAPEAKMYSSYQPQPELEQTCSVAEMEEIPEVPSKPLEVKEKDEIDELIKFIKLRGT